MKVQEIFSMNAVSETPYVGTAILENGKLTVKNRGLVGDIYLLLNDPAREKLSNFKPKEPIRIAIMHDDAIFLRQDRVFASFIAENEAELIVLRLTLTQHP